MKENRKNSCWLVASSALAATSCAPIANDFGQPRSSGVTLTVTSNLNEEINFQINNVSAQGQLEFIRGTARPYQGVLDTEKVIDRTSSESFFFDSGRFRIVYECPQGLFSILVDLKRGRDGNMIELQC